MPDPGPGPIWVGQTERSLPTGVEPAGIRVPGHFVAARLLVTADGVPVGQVDVPLTGGVATPAQVAGAVAAGTGAIPDPPAPPVSDEPLTVVVATRDRPDSVDRCVRAVLAGDHPAVTVLVVDNDPPDDRTEQVVRRIAAETGPVAGVVRYVREARRGASAGRNRGLAEARTPVVAFTDDDTEPDHAWASRIAGAFAADPELTGVSGPVLAARLGTAQEQASDTALAWNKGYRPRRFSLDEPPADSPVFPFSPGLFGIGANMAVRAEPVRRLGSFDEALGPGAETRGGEDIELLVRIVLDGQVLGYVPSAFVWHHHRPGDDELRSQMRGYALGLGAFLGKVALDRRARAVALRRAPAALARLRQVVRRESGEGWDDNTRDEGTRDGRPGTGGTGTGAARDALPSGAGRRKLRGLLTGPVLYLRARRRVRGADGAAPPMTFPPDPPADPASTDRPPAA
ncbi:glycosyltransferase family 2 protein [Pseudonocardia sp. KRD291]|uniref:glycosyltransferase n=1 Tax=Pseudonocardia sp. KRD291 TaxID=2792007 RepID=UPI001C4A2BCC|nr:glycosyltransferase family 2 protein [Pseudonocardia sp. KRD291]MBW0104693.1 glycosyltransferase [Pseudonocardia sp. KRD291]